MNKFPFLFEQTSATATPLPVAVMIDRVGFPQRHSPGKSRPPGQWWLEWQSTPPPQGLVYQSTDKPKNSEYIICGSY